MTVVLDASMTIAWLFDDERTAAAHEIMMRVVAEGALVPSLRRLEVANMLRNAVRRGRCDEDFASASLSRLNRFKIRIDGETDQHAWGGVRRDRCCSKSIPPFSLGAGLQCQNDLPVQSPAPLCVHRRIRRGRASRAGSGADGWHGLWGDRGINASAWACGARAPPQRKEGPWRVSLWNWPERRTSRN